MLDNIGSGSINAFAICQCESLQDSKMKFVPDSTYVQQLQRGKAFRFIIKYVKLIKITQDYLLCGWGCFLEVRDHFAVTT